MPLWSLTLERVLKLQKEAEQKQKELDVMVATSERVLWERDLDLFSETYAEFVQMEDDKVNMRPVSKGKRAKKPSTVRKQKVKKESDDDEEFVQSTKKAKAEPKKAAAKKEEEKKPATKKEEEKKPATKKEEEKKNQRNDRRKTKTTTSYCKNKSN